MALRLCLGRFLALFALAASLPPQAHGVRWRVNECPVTHFETLWVVRMSVCSYDVRSGSPEAARSSDP